MKWCKPFNNTIVHIDFEGVYIKFATTAQLLAMKRETIGLLRADAANSSRPQDFFDLAILNSILESEDEIDTDGYFRSLEDDAYQAVQDGCTTRDRTHDYGDR